MEIKEEDVSFSRLKLMTQTQDSKSKLKTQTHDSRTNMFYQHQSNQKKEQTKHGWCLKI